MDQTYKRWRNSKGLGQTAFVTTTCLDFAHLFQRQEMRTRCALHLLEACKHNDARLHAFVVMPHHVHYLVTPNESQTISSFTKSFKSYSARQMLPLLSEFERDQLSQQVSLNQRAFWKVGFRSWPVFSEDAYIQKINYIDLNPVRSELAKPDEVYRWGSNFLNQLGFNDGFGGILLPEAIAHFETMLK